MHGACVRACIQAGRRNRRQNGRQSRAAFVVQLLSPMARKSGMVAPHHQCHVYVAAAQTKSNNAVEATTTPLR